MADTCTKIKKLMPSPVWSLFLFMLEDLAHPEPEPPKKEAFHQNY